MTIELISIVPHVPSMCYKDSVPEFQQDMAEAMEQLGEKLKQLKPDAIVLVSCHWPSTFFHYVDATPLHKGVLTSYEAPDLIKDVPYEYLGDADLANELVQAAEQQEMHVVAVDDPYFVWDYGSVVPLRYLNPDGDIPVVNLSVTLAATLEETYKWGTVIKEVLQKSEKRIVFLASGALSHCLVRGRHNKPTFSEHALDKQFMDFMLRENFEDAYKMLPQYASMAKVESGGRHLAMLISLLEKGSNPQFLASGQSSGSWNVVMTFTSKKIEIEPPLTEESMV